CTFGIGLQSRAVSLVGSEAIERDQTISNVIGAFMRHPIADEISTTLWDDRKPMPRVFFEGIVLKRIEFVTDENGESHGSLRATSIGHVSEITELCTREGDPARRAPR